ncbi:MAG: hypothetical protein GDA68_16655 [Nitrospira sp. CR2.1]|nr:hypothetical protein [Nitrospira sp. CR2.1]
MYEFSSRISKVLKTASQLDSSEVRPDTLGAIAHGVLRLSNIFTRDNSGVRANYLEEPKLRQAYLAYYVPVNLAKVQQLLAELQPVLAVHKEPEFRVLDVGGGPGTAALALLDWACSTSTPPPDTIRMAVMDRSPAVLTVCAELWQSYLNEIREYRVLPLRTIKCNLERMSPVQAAPGVSGPGYHLIVLQNVLSELYHGIPDASDKRAALVADLLSMVTQDGSLMLIEPALRTTSRSLHELRDKLLASSQCSVYSPCLHDKNCPALVGLDDWCHEERSWRRPGWIEQIDESVGFIKDALKFSYVVFRKDGKALVPRSQPYHRVVSELRVMKGERRVWLCDAAGRSEVGRQDKDCSPSNAAFENYHRGAIVKISEIVRKERKGRLSTVGRILPQGTAEVIRPAEG